MGKEDVEVGVAMSGTQREHMLEYLQKLTLELKAEERRQSIKEKELHKVVNSLQQNISQLEISGLDTNSYEVRLCLECLRCLRNTCAGCSSNQDVILSCNITDQLCSLITTCLDYISQSGLPSETLLTLLRCSIQLSVNLVSNNNGGQSLIWSAFFPVIFKKLLTCGDMKSCQYSCMLLLGCLKSPNILEKFMRSEERTSISEAVLHLSTVETELDFSLQLANFLVLQENFIQETLISMNTEAKTILVEIIAAHLSEEQEDTSAPSTITSAALLNLAETFEKVCHSVINLATGEEKLSSDEKIPALVTKLLSTLCVATSSPSKSSLKTLQERKSLIISSLELLLMVHAIGKKGDNVFTVTQTLTSNDSNTNPVHGFRRDLVRLIGNLSYQCKENQDVVSELHIGSFC
ncbi:Ataxin-10 [Holothuria leucospilota]|uniref:Ataxin-10 n=1 Tax=Holothuria leucospilota TaxID=206669 RepID=A0A9Q1CNJ6_HOLLE|nr:Ataxin-10 [Holothuria leucospilota]